MLTRVWLTILVTLQSMISSLPVNPLVDDPDGHVVHVEEPTVDLYLSAAHELQGPPAFPVNPILHIQSNDCVRPVDELVVDPVPHDVHDALPTLLLYESAKHGVQEEEPSAPV
jgi:hypothetical protein